MGPLQGRRAECPTDCLRFAPLSAPWMVVNMATLRQPARGRATWQDGAGRRTTEQERAGPRVAGPSACRTNAQALTPLLAEPWAPQVALQRQVAAAVHL